MEGTRPVIILGCSSYDGWLCKDETHRQGPNNNLKNTFKAKIHYRLGESQGSTHVFSTFLGFVVM